jgi:hypothetical protein
LPFGQFGVVLRLLQIALLSSHSNRLVRSLSQIIIIRMIDKVRKEDGDLILV